MLSRIAEALFWIGRYVERAEDTARILDVHYHILLEDPWVDEAAICSALLDVMGVSQEVSAPTARTVNEVLAYDDANSTAITGALWAARENARGVRDTISSEMWESLNATWHAISERRALAGANPSPFFRFVKERAAHFGGLTESTMSRDEAWRFMCLGTALERVDMTCRLLTARWTDAAGSAGWVTTLRCCSAHEAYLRTYRRAVDTSLAASFLLLDRLFPRSVYYSLGVAERRLAELSPGAGRYGIEDAAHRAVGQGRIALEFRRIDELLVDLPAVLAEVQAAGAEASAAIAARYFHHTQPVRWTA
ncbi:MAG: alpha-E domain-containing protein [Acidimicrobiia bacterium]